MRVSNLVNNILTACKMRVNNFVNNTITVCKMRVNSLINEDRRDQHTINSY